MATASGCWRSPGKTWRRPQMQVQAREVQVLLGCLPTPSLLFLNLHRRWKTKSVSVLCRRYRQMEYRIRIYEYGLGDLGGAVILARHAGCRRPCGVGHRRKTGLSIGY